MVDPGRVLAQRRNLPASSGFADSIARIARQNVHVAWHPYFPCSLASSLSPAAKQLPYASWIASIVCCKATKDRRPAAYYSSSAGGSSDSAWKGKVGKGCCFLSPTAISFLCFSASRNKLFVYFGTLPVLICAVLLVDRNTQQRKHTTCVLFGHPSGRLTMARERNLLLESVDLPPH